MLTFIDANGMGEPLGNSFIWVFISIFLAGALALYALQSIGVFVMARRKGVAHAWIAFIPFVWFYILCKIIGKTKFFKTTFNKLAIVFCIIFAVSEFLAVAYQFLLYFPLAGNFLAGREIYIVASELVPQELTEYWVKGSGIFINPNNFAYPYGHGGAYPVHMMTLMNVIYYVSTVLSVLSIVLVVIAYINLFQMYWPQNHMFGLVLSILGIFPILVFALRKREPVDYKEFLRARYNAFYYGSFNNPNMPNGPQRPQEPSTPFEEFAEKGEVDPGNPFGEFEEKEKTEDKE